MSGGEAVNFFKLGKFSTWKWLVSMNEAQELLLSDIKSAEARINSWTLTTTTPLNSKNVELLTTSYKIGVPSFAHFDCCNRSDCCHWNIITPLTTFTTIHSSPYNSSSSSDYFCRTSLRIHRYIVHASSLSNKSVELIKNLFCTALWMMNQTCWWKNRWRTIFCDKIGANI